MNESNTGKLVRNSVRKVLHHLSMKTCMFNDNDQTFIVFINFWKHDLIALLSCWTCFQALKALDPYFSPIIPTVLLQSWVSNKQASCIMFQCKSVKASVLS